MLRSHKKIYELLGREAVHPFPARMAPGIAFEILAKAKSPLNVLDPMMGSGTVLAFARSKGHRAIGVDIDPLAVLISRVWTRVVDPKLTLKKAIATLARARTISEELSSEETYPRAASKSTKRFIDFWFDRKSRRQLASLSRIISRVHNPIARDVFWCALSRLIISKQAGASLAMDLAHSRPHKAFKRAPVLPFNKFLSAVEHVIKNCVVRKSTRNGPSPIIKEGDARKLQIKSSSIDLVLTSPPYLNAIDYIRCSKFSLVWMGYNIDDLQNLRGRSIGSERGSDPATPEHEATDVFMGLKLNRSLSGRHRRMLIRFIDDMSTAIREVSRVLMPGGRAIYVIGENTIRGTYIRNSKILLELARRNGLMKEHITSRELPTTLRYLPPPVKLRRRGALNGRMRREVIISLRKPLER